MLRDEVYRMESWSAMARECCKAHNHGSRQDLNRHGVINLHR
jgi:hypothetical protein